MRPYGIHWFKRDLRVTQNAALHQNHLKHPARVLGLFILDPNDLSRTDFSHARFAFLLKTLESLRDELRSRGGDLLVLDAIPEQGLTGLLSYLEKSSCGKPSLFSFSRDYEPFARTRDARVTELVERVHGVEVYTDRNHLLIEPRELIKPGNERPFYQVFTPFSRKWFELLRTPEIHGRLKSSTDEKLQFSIKWSDVLDARDGFADQLNRFKLDTFRNLNVEVPEAGEKEALRCLERFRGHLNDYGQTRDFPADTGTSKLSVFLGNGSITVSQVIAHLRLSNSSPKSERSGFSFLRQLVWREFYYHILWHRPQVETGAFIEKYRQIEWENREDYFEAWKNGETGYPIVDAGMRELKQTGWMHNRVRMITASFLTKDLLIDWRWGERYFMNHLLDGDLAANNGGWQWAASTGCDPQPYFRIFNPTLQSQRFDPTGAYLKRWLPERSHLSGKALHEPINPIVDHATQKPKALALYKNSSSKRP